MENSSNIEIRLPVIRERIIETLEPILVPNGYKVKGRTGENKFLRKFAQGYSQVQFFYNNYFPVGYEVWFSYGVSQNSITQFLQDFNIKYPFNSFLGKDFTNIGFGEGDFKPHLKEASFKSIFHFRNSIKSEGDLNKLLEEYRRIFKEEICPLDQTFSTAEGTFEYVKSNKESIARTGRTDMMHTCLIIARIHSYPDYDELYNYFLNALSNSTEFGVLREKFIETLENLHRYLREISDQIKGSFEF